MDACACVKIHVNLCGMTMKNEIAVRPQQLRTRCNILGFLGILNESYSKLIAFHANLDIAVIARIILARNMSPHVWTMIINLEFNGRFNFDFLYLRIIDNINCCLVYVYYRLRYVIFLLFQIFSRERYTNSLLI